MKKLILLLSLFVFSVAHTQIKLDLPNEKGSVSINGVKVIPYADGSFSICKYSAPILYSSKVEYFMYHYDKNGNLTGSKRAILLSTECPYGLDLMSKGNVMFDSKRKRWIMISTKKKQTEVSEWDENLVKVNSVKIDDTEDVSYCNKAQLSDGKILFYVGTKDQKSFKRYEYDTISKSLNTLLYSPAIYANRGKEGYTIGGSFVGVLDDVEYFVFKELKSSITNKNQDDCTITLAAYDPSEGEMKITESQFSLNTNTSFLGPFLVENVSPGPAENLYLEFDMNCMGKECGDLFNGFKLMSISKDGTLNMIDVWSGDQISWTGRPELFCHGSGDDFHLIFKGGDALTTKIDMETGEKSAITLFKSTRFIESRDLEIFFPDESSRHLLESLHAEGNKKFGLVSYIEDADGVGKLFLFSFGYYYTKMEAVLFK